MLSRRPLLYLTIPSLALLIGLWFRRKKAIAAKGSGNKSPANHSGDPISTNTATGSDTNPLFTGSRQYNNSKRDISDSVPIGSSDDGSLLNTSGCSSTNSNKSGPGGVTSGPNSRSPPIPIANKPGCGHTSDEVNSVEESDVESEGSAVDLPGSYERRNFEFVKNSHLYNKRTKGSMDVPIKVITASKSPKISPKNAFSEAATPNSKTNNKQQQSPKSPASGGIDWAAEAAAEESLIIQAKMSQLSLADDSVTVDNSVEQKTNSSPTKADSNSTTAANKENAVEKKVEVATQNGQPPASNSPPLSLYSNDSGKGSSPTQLDSQSSQNNCYEFLVHEKYVGLMIGRAGTTVKKLHKRFGVHMIVRRVPNCPRPTDRVCAIMGAPSDIEAALAFIRQRMPVERYPDLSLERVQYASTPVPALGMKESVVFKPQPKATVQTPQQNSVVVGQKPVMPIHYPVAQLPLSLSLVEGINNDVVISAILNGGHVFLQQQSHPTYQQLQTMLAAMATSYAAGDSPALDVPETDSICVAPVAGKWFRVVIVSSHVSTEGQQLCMVKFLDFGGFVTVPAADLRQIRADFMSLPFQSIECVLSNLRPMGGGEWAKAAADLVLQLGSGRVLQAQVAGYTVDGLPEVFLYATIGPDNIAFINQELVAQGYAEWMEDDEEEEAVSNEAQLPVLVQ